MKTIRIGIIGCGRISRQHVPRFKKIDEKSRSEIIALYDIKPAKARQCLKDNELSASIEIPGKEGSYRIVLEWFQSTEELSTRPLTDLVQEAVASLSFEEIKDYCIYEEWD